MALWFKPQTAGDPDTLETGEQRISLIMGLSAVVLMLWGLASFYVRGQPWLVPGSPVLPLADLIQQLPVGVAAMSLGIVLFGIIPIVRVALALWFFGQAARTREALVALVVLLELGVSFFWGNSG